MAFEAIGRHSGAVRLAPLTMTGSTISSIGTNKDYVWTKADSLGIKANEDASSSENKEIEVGGGRIVQTALNNKTITPAGVEVAADGATDSVVFTLLLSPTDYKDFMENVADEYIVVTVPWDDESDNPAYCESLIGLASGDLQGTDDSGFKALTVTVQGKSLNVGSITHTNLNTAMRGAAITPETNSAITLPDFADGDEDTLASGLLVRQLIA